LDKGPPPLIPSFSVTQSFPDFGGSHSSAAPPSVMPNPTQPHLNGIPMYFFESQLAHRPAPSASDGRQGGWGHVPSCFLAKKMRLPGPTSRPLAFLSFFRKATTLPRSRHRLESGISADAFCVGPPSPPELSVWFFAFPFRPDTCNFLGPVVTGLSGPALKSLPWRNAGRPNVFSSMRPGEDAQIPICVRCRSNPTCPMVSQAG